MNFLIDIRKRAEGGIAATAEEQEIINHLPQSMDAGDRLYILTSEQKISWLRPHPQSIVHYLKHSQNGLIHAYHDLVTIPAFVRKNSIGAMLLFHPGSAGNKKMRLFFFAGFFSLQEKEANQFFKAAGNGVRLLLTVPKVSEEAAKKLRSSLNNIKLITPFTLASFQPLKPAEKQGVKEKYTDGKEFFLYFVPDHQTGLMIDVLKAFSYFKKRQQSSFKMVFVLSESLPDSIRFKLDSYRYKDDVEIIHLAITGQLGPIAASAYAAIVPSLMKDYSLLVLGAMQAAVPVIAPFSFFTDDAVLVTQTGQPDELGEGLVSVYKDEALRNRLIAKGIEQAAGSNIQATCSQILHYMKEPG